MPPPDDAADRLGELQGRLIAIDVALSAVVAALPADRRAAVARLHDLHAEAARSVLLQEHVPERTLAAFEQDVRRTAVMFSAIAAAD